MKADDILREFMEDVEAVGIESVREDWPDLAITYRHARKYFKLSVEDPEADDGYDPSVIQPDEIRRDGIMSDDNLWKD